MIAVGAFDLHDTTPAAVRRVARAYLAAIGVQLVPLVAAAEAAGDDDLAMLLATFAVDSVRAKLKIEGDL